MHDLDPSPLAARVTSLERELAESERGRQDAEAEGRRFHMLLDSVLDYAFISFDLEGRVVGWSRGAERVLGYAEVEALGLASAVFFTPEDVARGEDLRELVVAREQGHAEDERWHLRRDGTRFWGSGVMSPQLDAGGELRGFTKVMRDHTARRLAEQRLRDSEDRFRLFSASVGDYALVPVDPHGVVSGWNAGAAGIFGYTAEEILGRDSACFYLPEDVARGEPQADLRRALADGRAEDERWMLRKDGSRFWAHSVTTPMRSDDDPLYGFARVLHDSSARKAAEELRARLEAHERATLQIQVERTGAALDRNKDELRALAGRLLTAQEEERRHIARELHDDLSQQLSVLAMRLAALRARLSRESGERVQAEAHGLHEFVVRLADDVRRLSHRLHPTILEDLGLAAALRRLLEEFKATRAQPVHYTATDLPDAVPRGVATALYRITQEALRNIGKHVGADPVSVTLRGSSDPDELHLTVADAGPGFDLAGVRGGLGLLSMQERARNLGGALHIDSRPGAGTRVVVRMPLA